MKLSSGERVCDLAHTYLIQCDQCKWAIALRSHRAFLGSNYFQNGFFNPAGANALSTFASVPVSSEIFSSNNREDGAFNSSPG